MSVATGKPIPGLSELPTGSSLVFSPDGKTAALADGKTVHLIDLRTGRPRCGFPDWGFSYSFAANIAFSPDGKLLAAGGAEVNSNGGSNGVRLIEVATGQVVRPLTGHTGWVGTVAFSPNGKLLASGSRDTTILLWDVFVGRVAPETAEELDRCWTELGSPKASVGQAAVAALLRVPDPADALARQRSSRRMQ